MTSQSNQSTRGFLCFSQSSGPHTGCRFRDIEGGAVVPLKGASAHKIGFVPRQMLRYVMYLAKKSKEITLEERSSQASTYLSHMIHPADPSHYGRTISAGKGMFLWWKANQGPEEWTLMSVRSCALAPPDQYTIQGICPRSLNPAGKNRMGDALRKNFVTKDRSIPPQYIKLHPAKTRRDV